MAQTEIPADLMRGGTSKGLVFLRSDLPGDLAERDAILLAAMGSPDPTEIDGVGGGHPLTSKVAIVAPSSHPDADVDYLFLQVWPDRPEVSDQQNCGNMLAAVGPFALEHKLLTAEDGVTPVRIWMENTQNLAVAYVQTPKGEVSYSGDARIDGVPSTHAPIPIEFLDVAGSTCGALLPTGNVVDRIDGIEVTCIDNGMPVVCLRASDFGLIGDEEPADIEANRPVAEQIERIRRKVGPLMNLGDVGNNTVPKMCLLSPPSHGGTVSTRTFIPHRVHTSIGVFGAVSVATACLIPGTVAAGIAVVSSSQQTQHLEIEHPTGFFTVTMDVHTDGDSLVVRRAALLRTARLLMRGSICVPA